MKKTISIIIILIITIFSIYKYIENIKKEAYIKIKINGQEIQLTEENKEKAIDLQMLDAQKDTKIQIELKNAKIKINKEEIKESKEITIGKINIQKENKIEIQAKKNGEFKYSKYIINTLPSKFLQYEIEGKSEEKGEYYLSTYIISGKKGRHYIYKINNEGQITFYKQAKNIPFNFKKNEIDGKITYTYLETIEIKNNGITTFIPANLIVLDENYNEIKKIGYLTEEGEINTENHDYLYLGENHYIIEGYTKEEVTNVPNYEGEKVKVWNCRIQEIKDGKIIWEFKSIDNAQLYEYYNENNIQIKPSNTYIDYMHINSIKIDPEDGNLVCSFRNIDAIIKISRKNGKIIWILGGKGDQFGLTKEQKFSKQHSISFLKNHEILIYDNAYDNKNTRILKIKINEKNKKIEEFKSYELNVYIPRMGAVQAVNEEKDIYLITYGEGNSKYAFQELNLKTGEVKFKFKIVCGNSLYCVNKYQ